MRSAEDARPEPRVLEIYRRVLIAIGRAEMMVAVVALVAATAISVAQILLRYGTGRSLWWAQEVSLLLVLVAYFVGGAVVFRLRYDVVVSYLMDKVPVAVRHPIYILAQIATLVFWATVAVYVIRMMPAGTRTYSAILRIPKVYAMLPLLYASLSISLLTVYVIVSRLRMGWRTRVSNLDDLDHRIRVRIGGEAYP